MTHSKRQLVKRPIAFTGGKVCFQLIKFPYRLTGWLTAFTTRNIYTQLCDRIQPIVHGAVSFFSTTRINTIDNYIHSFTLLVTMALIKIIHSY